LSRRSGGTQDTLDVVTFFLSRTEYGVGVGAVQEVVRVPHILPMPDAPAPVKGGIELRGRTVPVIDLPEALGLGRAQVGQGSRVLVARLGERLFGLLVDGPSRVLKVPESRVEAAPVEIGVEGSCVRGVVRLDDRLILLLDMEKVMGFSERAEQDVSVGALEPQERG
jgi:purine-binding chemotaxis protein CheW